jgi:hypothetical protein
MDIMKFFEKLIGKHAFSVLVIVVLLSIYSIIRLENMTKGWLGEFIPSIPDSLKVIFYVILLIFFIKIFLLVWEKITFFFFLVKNFLKGNELNLIPRLPEWIFQGSLKIIGNSLELTASNSGCLIKNPQYKNFIMTFNMEIRNGGHAGIVFRAQDLENYLMIQFVLGDRIDGSGTIITDIIPHIRFEGDWETFNITPAFTKSPEPYHPTEIKYHHGIPITLEVNENLTILTIKSNEKTEEFRWNIPTHTDPNLRQHIPYKKDKELLTKPDPLEGQFVPRIWFRNKYGMVGFRAHSWERIVINNLKIKRI